MATSIQAAKKKKKRKPKKTNDSTSVTTVCRPHARNAMPGSASQNSSIATFVNKTSARSASPWNAVSVVLIVIPMTLTKNANVTTAMKTVHVATITMQPSVSMEEPTAKSAFKRDPWNTVVTIVVES
jgi:hypothetical protein